MKYRVLRPHDGDKFYNVGDIREGAERDLKHLVPLTLEPISEKAAEDQLRQDGPTVAEYVSAGYLASNYPPEGYASRSTQEEIAEAISAQKAKADPARSNKAEKASPKNKGD